MLIRSFSNLNRHVLQPDIVIYSWSIYRYRKSCKYSRTWLCHLSIYSDIHLVSVSHG